MSRVFSASQPIMAAKSKILLVFWRKVSQAVRSHRLAMICVYETQHHTGFSVAKAPVIIGGAPANLVLVRFTPNNAERVG